MAIVSYKNAVALSYNPKNGNAPIVAAIGELRDAELVVSLAERYGIPVIEHPFVVRLLKDRELDEEIPASLFEAVATILTQLEREGYSVRDVD